MDVKVSGEAFPILEVRLVPGETLLAEPGEFGWMSENIRMKTSAKLAGANSLFGAFKRAVAGGGFFMTEYTCDYGSGSLTIAAKIPGEIVPLALQPQMGYMIHRHGFLCANGDIELGLGFQQRFSAGLFGGSGFILQKLKGRGKAWIELGGQITVRELSQGETLLVHPGHVGMFEESVSFEMTTVPGIRNMFFGGNGIFVARLRGPGKVWLQSLTLPNLAHALSPYISSENAVDQAEGALGAGVVASIARAIFK